MRLPRAASAVIAATTLLGGMALLISQPTAAAESGDQDQHGVVGLSEVVVTARKRSETVLQTPEVLQVFTPRQINNLHITDFYSLASVTPGLNIGTGFSTVGAAITLRGIGNGLGAIFVDQSVLLNIDGESVNQGQFYKMGLFDVAQVTVLKGPQALYYGKSSDAGIVAITSADPTPTWQAELSSGYEFIAHQVPVQGYISGPLTDHLGMRLAGYFSHMDGWLTNSNPYNSNRTYPDGNDFGGRLTLQYKLDGLKATLKGAYWETKNDAFDGSIDQRHCLYSHPQVQQSFYDDCSIDTVATGNYQSLPYLPAADFTYGTSAAFAAGAPSPLFRNGMEYEEDALYQGVLRMEYDLAPSLQLTSLSAWSEVRAQEAGRSFLPIPEDYLVIAGLNVDHDASQELRLTSSIPRSWTNFAIGAVYDDAEVSTDLPLDIPGITFYTNDREKMTTTTSSVFGQLLFTPIEHWEFDVGARFTHVHKYLTSLFVETNVAPGGQEIGQIPFRLREISQSVTTPEVTLTYRPTHELTAFVSYKQGYKGPGFNADASSVDFAVAGEVNGFGGERVHGGEGGVKALFLDRVLSLTLSLYDYQYNGLQVAFVSNTNHSVLISPSADAKVRGVELDSNYQLLQGVTLHGFANFNDSHYTSFPSAPCYGGETAVEGCVTNAAGSSVQNLAGHRLNNAPLWTGGLGLDYVHDLRGGYTGEVSLNGNFSSPYYYDPTFDPLGLQSGYATVDATLRVGSSSGRWDVALIGRNLSNKIIAMIGQDDSLVTPGVPVDVLATAERGRQILLQVTIRPLQ